MKIAQVVSYNDSVPPTNKNGLEFVVSWITEELVRRGHDVTLFAPENSKTCAKLTSILPNDLLSQNHSITAHTKSGWNTTLAASMADNFDIIHCHTSTIAQSMPFIKTPVVYTLHHAIKDDLYQDFFSTLPNIKKSRFIFDQLSKINYVAISKKQENDFLRAEPYYFKKHSVIYNGIPIEKFIFNSRPKDYLLFIGYMNKNKGADVAVRVAHKLGLKLILAGSYEGEEKFFDERIRPFLNNKIKYLGPVNFEQKNVLYGDALVKLAPLQWDEPFGLTLIEAQACGTPVIAFHKGAAPELIVDRETGFVVDSEEEMIDAVGKIKEINRADCRKWVEEKFSVEKMVDNYVALYSKLVAS